MSWEEKLERIFSLFREDRLDEALELVEELLSQRPPPEVKAQLFLRKIKVFLETGNYPEALEILRRERRLLEEQLRGRDRLLLVESEVHLYQATGNPKKARRALAKLRDDSPEALFVRARFNLTSGELDEAAQLFRKALERSRDPGVREPAAVNLANVLVLMGKFEEADELRAEEHHLLVWNYLESFELVARGKPSEALVICKKGWEAVRHQRHLRGMTHWAIVQAVAWYALGEEEKAELYADLAVEISEKTGDEISKLRARIYKALLFSESPAEALGLARRAEELGFQLERAAALYAAARAKALRGEPHEELVSQVISQGYWGLLRFMAQAAPEPLAGTPFEAPRPENPRLKLQTFGGCRALWGRKAVGLKGRLAELLVFLALTARNPRPKEEVAHLFWPDAPFQRAMKNYYDTVTRIKKALRDAGIPVPRSREHAYASLPFDFSVDLLEFQGLVSTAKSLERVGNLQGAARFYRQAVSLYKGDFLPFSKIPIFAAQRESAREEYREALVFLMKFYRDLGEPEAKTWALKLLELEPRNEEALKVFEGK